MGSIPIAQLREPYSAIRFWAERVQPRLHKVYALDAPRYAAQRTPRAWICLYLYLCLYWLSTAAANKRARAIAATPTALTAHVDWLLLLLLLLLLLDGAAERWIACGATHGVALGMVWWHDDLIRLMDETDVDPTVAQAQDEHMVSAEPGELEGEEPEQVGGWTPFALAEAYALKKQYRSKGGRPDVPRCGRPPVRSLARSCSCCLPPVSLCVCVCVCVAVSLLCRCASV